MKDLKENQPNLTDEEAAKIAASKIADSKPKSRMYYKIGASREMAGGKKVDPKSRMSDKLKESYASLGSKNVQTSSIKDANGRATVEFQTGEISGRCRYINIQYIQVQWYSYLYIWLLSELMLDKHKTLPW